MRAEATKGAPLAPILRAEEPARVAALGDLVVAFTGAMLFEIEPGPTLVQKPRLLQGMENASEIVAVSGNFPDPAWLSTTLYSRITGQPIGKRTYRWYAKRWGPAAAPLHDDPPIALGDDGTRSLALLKAEGGPRLVVARAMDAKAAPTLPDAAAWDGSRGEIVSGNPMLVLLPAKAAATTGVFTVDGEALSRAELPPGRVLAHASHPKGGAVLAGVRGETPFVARFVGGKWREVDVATGKPTAVAVASDGTIAVASGAKVHVRTPTGETTSHDAPGDVVSLALLPGGKVVASTDKSVVATGGEAPLDVPDKTTVWQVRGLYGQAPATRACKDLWVPLANLGPTHGYVPDELPWLEEDSLKQGDVGKSTYVVEDDGVKMTVGAIVANIAAGEAIVSTIGKRAGIQGQPVLCHAPEVTHRYVKGKRVRG